jgi:hypothetical protein
MKVEFYGRVRKIFFLVWCLQSKANKSVGGTPTEAGETPALPAHYI